MAFDEGDPCVVSASELVLCSMMHVEQEVLANDGEEMYNLATIKKVLNDGQEFEVEFAVDQSVKWYANIFIRFTVYLLFAVDCEIMEHRTSRQ